VKACVFDAYGTLFDFASAAKRCRDVLGDGIDKLTALWRDQQLQYTWLRALQGRHTDSGRSPVMLSTSPWGPWQLANPDYATG
jgi:HAD superfamily hydrolase (TIGR01493 family)